jgi:tRNA G46 methylase TrmB
LHTASRPVTSNQAWIHPRLPSLLARHLEHPDRGPLAAFNSAAFDRLHERLDSAPAPLVFDSFCGTGQSTALLAARHPGHLVVGIDKSAHRLGRHKPDPAGNYLLLRADCEAIWRLALGAGWRLDHHYLFYPNPWPKAAHLGRRVHGSAAFAHLLALGGRVELRSNWQLYVEEFGVALHLAGYRALVRRLEPDRGITRFEEKYRRSGHSLWACEAALAAR